jgi:hypothetical protein
MSLVQTLITSQSEQNKLLMTVMSERVQTLETMLYNRPAGSAGGPPPNPLDQVKQTAETIEMLDTIRGSLGGGGGGGGELESVIPMITEVVKAMVATRQAPAAAQPTGNLRAPKRRRKRLPKKRRP